MMRFRLLAGMHVGPDYSQPANELGKRPSKVYKAGDVVLSESDLEQKLGQGKFQALDRRGDDGRAADGDPPVPQGQQPGYSFPAGQVLQGHQVTSGVRDNPEGITQVTGSEDRVAPHLHAERMKAAGREVDPATQLSETVRLARLPGRPAGESKSKESAGDEARENKGPPTASVTPPGRPPEQKAQQTYPPLKGQKAASSKQEYLNQLDRLSVEELKGHADEQEVDLGNAKTKQDILKAFRESTD